MSAPKQKVNLPKTLMTYKLTPKQDAVINYLIPSVTSFLLYTFLLASDIALVFRHFKDENPIWASLTLFVMCLPSLCAYIITISSWELWPDMEGCERDNCVWFNVKTLEHVFFPIWSIWRYAERLFWSIEAVRSTEDKSIASAIAIVSAPRSIELYFFLHSFLHSLPQMLIQLNILMRQDYNIDKQTADAEVLSFAFNLTRLAATITFYQRFKSQKLTGKEYPWFKAYKRHYPPAVDQVDSKSETGPVEDEALVPTAGTPAPSESRRSSDFYMEPVLRETPGTLRETSIVDGPPRRLYQESPKRVVKIKGLPEDDLAGKLVAFIWWTCFLLARILAISSFSFFYPRATFGLLAGHVFIVTCFLLYDVKSDDVKRSKTLFFIFIGLIYIFCIIEFKIKFKKTKFIYWGYFVLVSLENFTICLIWWLRNVEDLQSDHWFRFIFLIVIFGSLFSITSMSLYMMVYKPKKIIVNQKILN